MSGSNSDISAILAGIQNTDSTSSNSSPPITFSSTTIPTNYQTTGGLVSTTPTISVPATVSSSTPSTNNITSDFRVRISPSNSSFYGGTSAQTGSATSTASSAINGSTTSTTNLLTPLIATNGVLFPYSPSISYEQTVDYTQTNMIHTNMDYNVYQRTPSVNISITGKFAIQNQVDGVYTLAVLHFFRTASKMYFGAQAAANGTAGLPPPILILNGYGTYMFNKLPCILKSHSWSYSDQIDTVTISVAGGIVRLPSMFDLTVSLTVQQTPQYMRNTFSLDAFRSGALMQKGGFI